MPPAGSRPETPPEAWLTVRRSRTRRRRSRASPLPDRITFELQVARQERGRHGGGERRPARVRGRGRGGARGRRRDRATRTSCFRGRARRAPPRHAARRGRGRRRSSTRGRAGSARCASTSTSATKTGTFWNASAFVEPDFYFSGAVVTKTGEDRTRSETASSPAAPATRRPDWSFRIERADVEIDGYAHVRNARVRVKKLPVFYWPYLVWPAKTERTSGLADPEHRLLAAARRLPGDGLLPGPRPSSATRRSCIDGYSERASWAPATSCATGRARAPRARSTLYFLRDRRARRRGVARAASTTPPPTCPGDCAAWSPTKTTPTSTSSASSSAPSATTRGDSSTRTPSSPAPGVRSRSTSWSTSARRSSTTRPTPTR